MFGVEYEGESLEGIYSTLDKAKERADELTKLHSGKWIKAVELDGEEQDYCYVQNDQYIRVDERNVK